MKKYDQSPLSFQQALRYERLHASVMSLICGLLFLFAMTAASRLPDYLAASDYARLAGVILFGLLAITGVVVNIRHHICLSRLAVMAYPAINYGQRRRATPVSQMTEMPNHPRLLYFGSKTCGDCIAQGHYLARLDGPFQAFIEPIDVEQSPELAQQYGIMTLPTTILIDDLGNVRYINPGLANPFKLTRQLNEVLWGNYNGDSLAERSIINSRGG